MGAKLKQLNPFEIKSILNELLGKINSPADIPKFINDFELLDSQEDKNTVSKILFKELVNAKTEKISIICFLLERYVPKQDLINKLWESLKNKNLNSEVKITILNLLRDMDSDWSYEACEDYLGNEAQDILDENTKELLNTAIINPEVQIDFMDFMSSLKVQDKITLLNSFGNDFSDDALANILIPVFEANPNSPEGQEALNLLGETKSQLALHVLEKMQNFAKGELYQNIRKTLAKLKMAGIRQDNTKEFYSKILSETSLGDFYITDPDGYGDIAMIFTRITKDERLRLVSIVINTDCGIKDCFGFYDISKFECEKILERFFKNEKAYNIPADSFKTILHCAEGKTASTKGEWILPYEYVCWKNLLADVDFEEESIEKILKEQVFSLKCEIEKLEEIGFSEHWFLGAHYSDEFEELIKELKESDVIENLTEKYLPKIFYPEEKQSWIEKLHISAYIRYALGKDEQAGMIYYCSQNGHTLNELFETILKKSIYEYFITIKYNNDLNDENFDYETIEARLKYIEEKWVKNV